MPPLPPGAERFAVDHWDWSIFIHWWPMFLTTIVITAIATWFIARAWYGRRVSLLEAANGGDLKELNRLRTQIQSSQTQISSESSVHKTSATPLVTLTYSATNDEPN